MKRLLFAGAFASLVAASPAMAQNPAYPTPDNNTTRSDDVDPSEAPYLNDEYGRPSSGREYSLPPTDDGTINDQGDTGASSGENGEGEEAPPLPPDALPPGD
jgi:hypothetical protein